MYVVAHAAVVVVASRVVHLHGEDTELILPDRLETGPPGEKFIRPARSMEINVLDERRANKVRTPNALLGRDSWQLGHSSCRVSKTNMTEIPMVPSGSLIARHTSGIITNERSLRRPRRQLGASRQSHKDERKREYNVHGSRFVF